MGVVMGTSLKIRDNLTPLELRRWARKEARGQPAARAYAIANALEGMSRAEAARLAGDRNPGRRGSEPLDHVVELSSQRRGQGPIWSVVRQERGGEFLLGPNGDVEVGENLSDGSSERPGIVPLGRS